MKCILAIFVGVGGVWWYLIVYLNGNSTFIVFWWCLIGGICWYWRCFAVLDIYCISVVFDWWDLLVLVVFGGIRHLLYCGGVRWYFIVFGGVWLYLAVFVGIWRCLVEFDCLFEW